MNSQEKPQGSILALLVRIYVVIGTSLYYLLFTMEQLIARLGNNSKLPILDTFAAEKWQVKSVRLTLAFPVAFPVIFLRNLLLLVCALIWTVLRFIARFLQWVVLRTVRASKPIADRTASTVQTIWEETAQSADESLPISLPDMRDVRETMAETGDRVRDTLGAVGESLGSAASTVGERASDVVDVARGARQRSHC